MLYPMDMPRKIRYIKRVFLALAIATISLVVFFFVAIAYRPSGPFDPLAEADFFFDKPGTRELTFTPKFFRDHEVAIIASEPFPAKEQFTWKATVEVYRFGIRIDQHVLEENHRGLTRSSLDSARNISFGWIRTFDLIPGKTTVRITVIQGDSSSSKYLSNFKVVVRPSPII